MSKKNKHSDNEKLQSRAKTLIEDVAQGSKRTKPRRVISDSTKLIRKRTDKVSLKGNSPLIQMTENQLSNLK